MKLSLLSEQDILQRVALAMRQRRISLNLTQKQAAEMAGLSVMTVSKFEKTGIISLSSISSLLIAYGMGEQILKAFEDHESWSLDELKNVEQRKRVRHAGHK